MARKTSGNVTTNRSKKTGATVQPAAVQVAPEVDKDVRKNGRAAANVPVDLEEEIRRRAYELYLQRAASAGNGNGNENQDWLIAEREIRSRHGSQEHQRA